MSKLGWCSKHDMSYVAIKYPNGAKLVPCCPMCLHKVTGCQESLLEVQTQDLAKQRQELERQQQKLTDQQEEIAQLQRANKQLQDAYDQETRRLQQELSRVCLVIAGNYWSWQGDGTDNLESLNCPVIVDPKLLQQWMQQLNAVYGLNDLADREG